MNGERQDRRTVRSVSLGLLLDGRPDELKKLKPRPTSMPIRSCNQ